MKNNIQLLKRTRWIWLSLLAVVVISLVCVEGVYGQEGGNVTLYYDWSKIGGDRTSYDFFNKIYVSQQDGPFSLFWYAFMDFVGDPFFTVSYPGQRGLIRLGETEFNPALIDIPESGYVTVWEDEGDLEVKEGHVYISRDKVGKDHRYILLKVVDIFYIPGQLDIWHVDLEYYALLTGKIQVRTNINAGFSIEGPRSFQGNSTPNTPWEKERVLTGTFTISFNPVAGYQRPPSQTMTLSEGGVIVFDADYEPVDTQEQPIPSNGSNGFPVEIIVAIIGGIFTVIVAVIYYRAAIKKK